VGSGTRTHVNSGTERNEDPLCFLARCGKKQLNQPIFYIIILSCFVLFDRATLVILYYYAFVCVLSLGCHGYNRLSVPVKVTEWKDLYPKWSVLCWCITHSLNHFRWFFRKTNVSNCQLLV